MTQGQPGYTVELMTWQAAVRKRDDCICTKCRVPARVVHHVIPIRDRPEATFDVGNGIVVCPSCHQKLHNLINAQFDIGRIRSEKLSKAHLGKPEPRESIEKRSRTWKRKRLEGSSRLGKTFEEIYGEARARELRDRARQSHLGKTRSPESIEKQRETNRRRREETKS